MTHQMAGGVAVVTRASRSIDRAIALALSRDTAFQLRSQANEEKAKPTV